MLSYEKTLLDLAKADPNLMVLTAENRAPMRNIIDALGPQFLDTGITEQAMIGIAAGLALRGRHPVCHALAPFLTMRAFEFIRTDLGLPGLPATLVGFIPGVLSDGNGPTHQALEDVGLMRGIPGMQVFCPADEDDLADALPSILASSNPSYIRWHQTPAVVTHEKFAIGRAEVLAEGSDIHILTYGYLFRECFQAAKALRDQGLKVGLTNLRTLSPVDEEAIARAANSARLVVTVEDHFLRGGLASILAEVCLKRRIHPVALTIGLDTWFRAGRLPEVLRKTGLDSASLVKRIGDRFEEVANV
jgi:transketolase